MGSAKALRSMFPFTPRDFTIATDWGAALGYWRIHITARAPPLIVNRAITKTVVTLVAIFNKATLVNRAINHGWL